MDTLVIGIDVAKELHWAVATVPDPCTGKARTVLSHRVNNAPDDIATLIEEITELQSAHGTAVVGIDILGGVARLLECLLWAAGLRVVHVPGLAVKVNRRATRGGEHKSDPRDARVIADLVRTRDDLRTVTPVSGDDAELALLVGRRRELTEYQTNRMARLRDLLCSVHPGLERIVNPRNKLDLALLARYVTPAEIRRAGHQLLVAHLSGTGRHNRALVERLVTRALDTAGQQHVVVPGQDVAAWLVKDLAAELLGLRDKLAAVDAQVAQRLDRHPDAALIQSLPGMGATLTSEFLAAAGNNITRFPTPDQLASAAGVAPALQQSGKTRYLQRATGGDRALKRVFYQAAFCALQRDPTSRAYYDRKRREGKTHHQAVIALARRRVNVLHAILRNRQPYQARPPRVTT